MVLGLLKATLEHARAQIRSDLHSKARRRLWGLRCADTSEAQYPRTLYDSWSFKVVAVKGTKVTEAERAVTCTYFVADIMALELL